MTAKREMTHLTKSVRGTMLLFFAVVATTVMGQGLATTGPTVGGNVFGGGRMADVEGSTLVTIVNAKSVGGVFGGNDIAGEVKSETANAAGNSCAEVIVGTSATTDYINIGSVYGGGNGYYYYPTIGTDVSGETAPAGDVLGYESSDRSTVYATLTGTVSIPKCVRTKVTINATTGEKVYIDSVFGGAKNAFVSATSDNSTDITINGGTIYSVFGGNNYGGTLGAGSTHSIVVSNTKYVTPHSSTNLGGADGHAGLDEESNAIADAHGIRYIFGGGNKVPGQNTNIVINGGQIDTIFAGGNSADVATANVTVNVTSPIYATYNNSYYSSYEGKYINDYVDATGEGYDAQKKAFDIRCLFGGNNQADMSGVPTLTLTKGGIHNVYGGGNRGVMNGSVTYASQGLTDNDGNTTATLSTKVVVSSDDIVVDTIYGGGQSAGTVADTYVEVAAGNVGTIFGGTNIQGRIATTAKTNVNVNGGTVHETVFGGSNGFYRCPNNYTYEDALRKNSIYSDANRNVNLANDSIPHIWHTNVKIENATVLQHVYAAGNVAIVGKPDLSDKYPYGTVKLRIGGTSTVIGSADATMPRATVFAGGNFACVFGLSDMYIYGSPTIYGDVYGGNDKTGTVSGAGRGLTTDWDMATVSTDRPDGVEIENISGLYPVLNSSHTNVQLNQENAASYMRIEGTPTITGSVYGGGNGNYNYAYYDRSDNSDEGTLVYSPAVPDPDKETVMRCYLPPNTPTQFSSFVDVHMEKEGNIGAVYGGGNSATGGEYVRYGNGNYLVNPVDGTGYLPSADSYTSTFGSPSVGAQVFVYLNCIGDDPLYDAAHVNDNVNIGTLFGGNNLVEMNTVPHLILLKGKVGTIYGGGNQGPMTRNGSTHGVPTSTYVGLGTQKVVVTKDIYGGCNVADVKYGTFVYLQKGHVEGHIYGGNDVSGHVSVSRVLIEGKDDDRVSLDGYVFGGGNGNYVYANDENNAGRFKVSLDGGSTWAYTNTNGRPYVYSTDVEVKGNVELNNNIYGGGLAGDCRNTTVTIDAAKGDFHNKIFGAGCGDTLNIGNNCVAYVGYPDSIGGVDGVKSSVGNVLGTATTNILRMQSYEPVGTSRAAIFGGGHAGDVTNTILTLDTSCHARIRAIYAGCLASNISGLAHATINGYTPDSDDTYTVDTVYGGNDFSGKVQTTLLDINSGNFEHIFGAGNGDYDYTSLMSKAYKDTDPSEATVTADGYVYAAKDSYTVNEGDDDNPDNHTYYRYWKYGVGCQDSVPYSMNVTVNYNGGYFNNTVYGGGNMGLVGDRDMDPADMGMDVAVATRDEHIGKITVNVHAGEFNRHLFTGARGKSDMNGTYFGAANWVNPVYKAALISQGKSEAEATEAAKGKNVLGNKVGKQLAYAYKQLNMDGGVVDFSIYGGSEAVDDGYPYECMDNTGYDSHDPGQYTQTTMRPSSVLNVIGGKITKSAYGGGYQGNIYGSVYFNIGRDAVNDSPVWTRTYGTAQGAGVALANSFDYTSGYKPALGVASVLPRTNQSDLRMGEELIFSRSIYGASDWGEALDNPYFSTRGVFGGETHIYIDGEGYDTHVEDDDTREMPQMNIAFNIIGAGTSTEGGDMNRLIVFRHYGNYNCPYTSKSLYSIQRADKLVLDHVYITLLGEQDAYSAYASPNYCICRIDTVLMRIDNIVMLEAPSLYIGNLVSMKDSNEVIDISNASLLYDDKKHGLDDYLASEPADDLHDNLLNGLASGETCDSYPDDPGNCENLDFCQKLSSYRGNVNWPGAFNTLVLRNGSYMKISPFIDQVKNNASDTDPDKDTPDGKDDPAHEFGHVYGWMYLVAQDNTMSYVYAGDKRETGYTDDGGFVVPCDCSNTRADGDDGKERDYTDVDRSIYGGVVYNEPYRVWSVGTREGTRTRHITLVANATPDSVLNYPIASGSYDVSTTAHNDIPAGFTVADGANLAYATAKLELPPSDSGNFYVINSVIIDMDNGGQLKLADQGYDYIGNNIFQKDGLTSADVTADSYNDFTFGLVFSSLSTDNNFYPGTGCPSDDETPDEVVLPTGEIRKLKDTDGHRFPCWPQSMVNGNKYLTEIDGYISQTVNGKLGVVPTFDFTLTYNTDIHQTITRDVVFTMYEYDKDGKYVGPIDVTVTISTVIRDFADLSAPVLAMFNEGITNEYVRKISIPASFVERDLYLEAISWHRDDENKYEKMLSADCTQPDGDSVTVLTDCTKSEWFYLQGADAAITDNNQFAITLRPTESSSENTNNTLGWYSIYTEEIDVFKTTNDKYSDATSSSLTPEQQKQFDSEDYDGDGTDKKLELGRTELGLPVGRLDGRSTANIDVALSFDGNRLYNDQYFPPLANIILKMHWYNTKIDGDGVFYVKVYLRTREHGDTIYMAPEATLTRTDDYGVSHSLRKYDPDNDGPLTKDLVKANHPDLYLTNFEDVFSVYEEGDVIDIMETIPIDNQDVPVSIIGDDYSIIQVIRYSGSHFKFPSLSCANRDPMLEVTKNGRLTMRNVWLNGSGNTRVKPSTDKEPTAEEISNKMVSGVAPHYYYENWRREPTQLYSHAPIIYIHQNGNANLSSNVRVTNNFNDMTMQESDIVTNVKNYILPGGAVAIYKDPDETVTSGGETKTVTYSPTLVLNHNDNIYDNIICDRTKTASESTAGNYGGAVYMNGGSLTIGSLARSDININVKRNFYLHDKTFDNAFQKVPRQVMGTGSTVKENYFVYAIDTGYSVSNVSSFPSDLSADTHFDTVMSYNSKPVAYSLSNIYLTRTPVDNCLSGIADNQSDVVTLLSTIDGNSAIGISKWFPAYYYTAGGSSHPLYYDNRTMLRDTIVFATISHFKSDGSMVQSIYESNVFFNDSNYFSSTDVSASTDHEAFTFDEANKVLYCGNTADNPGYDDRQYIFYHKLMSQFNIYLQRCATFGKGGYHVMRDASDCTTDAGGTAITLPYHSFGYGDSIFYRYNKDAVCEASTDTIVFKVGGGFFPYTYVWYDATDTVFNVDGDRTSGIKSVQHDQAKRRVSMGSPRATDLTQSHNDIIRYRSERDTMILRNINVNESMLRSTYAYQVEATDASGHCTVIQPVRIRVVKISSDHHDGGTFFYDYANFLRHRSDGTRNDSYDKLIANGATDAAGTVITHATHDSVDDGGNVVLDPEGQVYPNYLAMDKIRSDVEAFYRVRSPGVDSSSFHDKVVYDDDDNLVASYVPEHHLNLTPGEAEFQGGIRRAGYSNYPSYDPSTGTGGDKYFQQEPYVTAGDPNPAREPRYLRLYKAFKLSPVISPVEAAGTTGYVGAQDPESNRVLDLAVNEFCPGEIVRLVPTNINSEEWEYIAWNYDPSGTEVNNFVVTASDEDNKSTVYYGPKDYWYKVVTTNPGRSGGYIEHYNGDVTIKSREGLAWLISTVNGYNGQAAKSFRNNTVYLDFTRDITVPDGLGGTTTVTVDSVDMSKYKWTPLGTMQNPFKGKFEGKNSDQVIANVKINEASIPNVGLFGYVDNATLSNFQLDYVIAKGSNNVAGVAGYSTNGTSMSNITIKEGVLFSEYCIAGFAARSIGTNMDNLSIGLLRLKGGAIYAGGFYGYGTSTTVTQPHIDETAGLEYSRLNAIYFRGVEAQFLSAIYLGSIAGYNADGTGNGKGAKSGSSKLVNGYSLIVSGADNKRVGGLVGYAEDMDIQNCYAFGEMQYSEYSGGLVGSMGNGVNISNSYFLSSMADSAVGVDTRSGIVTKSTSFSGKADKVMLAHKVDGYSNMTRALNKWVDANGDTTLSHWRSDLEGKNFGYPMFGTPDMIKVNDTTSATTCDSYEFDGQVLTESGTYVLHVVDSADYLDSTLTLLLTINHGDSVAVSDTVRYGDDYNGYGFSLTADEIKALAAQHKPAEVWSLQRIDSLYNINGCDSTVTLTLYVLGSGVGIDRTIDQLKDVKVYPNPTRGIVNVEGSDMTAIEVYDVSSRRMHSAKEVGNRYTFDMSGYASGSYYIRVTTQHGTVVKKVIKK